MDTHYILDDKVRIYQRENSQVWQCQTRLDGDKKRISSKTADLHEAKLFAQCWYYDLRGVPHEGKYAIEQKPEHTFSDASDKFIREYPIITNGDRNPRYIRDHVSRIENHLRPFMGEKGIAEITAGLIQEYRIMRLQPQEDGARAPTRSTLHHEIVTLRQVMKTAQRHGWIKTLPDFSAPYRASSKVAHRAWFSPEEYKMLYNRTRDRVKEAEGSHWEHHAKQLHDYVLFMANTGLRPDEVNRLEYRDVTLEKDEKSKETILVIKVRGKTGVGYCKSTSGAVFPFKRLNQRNRPKSTDLIFPNDHKKQFNHVLADTNLKFDREGNRRTAYSLRHTYICLRLLEGANIYQIAKNCRTSVEMIEKHYAVHLKNTLDAEAINIRKSS